RAPALTAPPSASGAVTLAPPETPRSAAPPSPPPPRAAAAQTIPSTGVCAIPSVVARSAATPGHSDHVGAPALPGRPWRPARATSKPDSRGRLRKTPDVLRRPHRPAPRRNTAGPGLLRLNAS